MSAELARRHERAVAERVRRGRQKLLEGEAARLLEKGYAARYLVQAGRFMSRRGMRQLRGLAMSDDPKVSLPAMRILNDAIKVLESVRLAEMNLGLREQPEDGEPRRVRISWTEAASSEDV